MLKCKGELEMIKKLMNWNVLFIQYLKRDWKLICLWVVLLGLFCGGFVPAFVEITKGNGLIGMFETLQNPAMISMIGSTPITDATQYTLGAMYSHMMLVFCAIIAMIVSIMHVVSHTRKEEENGLAEFVSTYSIGRLAPSFALLVEESLIHLLLFVFIGSIMTAFQVETIEMIPSFLFAASVVIGGLMGVGIAMIMSQIAVTSSFALASSLLIVGLLYLMRGATDILSPSLSKINPMGWTYLTYPFTENNWIYIGVGFIFCFVITGISFALEIKRDIGAGYLPEMGNHQKVSRSLLSVHGLIIRLNRGMVVGWVVALTVLGAAYGSIYGDMQTFLEGNDLLKTMFQMQGISIEASFTMTIMSILAGLSLVMPITLVNQLYTQETKGYLSQIYAKKTSRGQVYWTMIVFAIVTSVFLVLGLSLGLGGAAISVMKTAELELLDFVQAGFAYFPAVLFIIGLTGVILGWSPKYGKALYVYVVYNIMLSYFGKLVKVPEIVNKTAILSWIPRLPADEFKGSVALGIAIISLVFMIIGYIGYKQRDLIESV